MKDVQAMKDVQNKKDIYPGKRMRLVRYILYFSILGIWMGMDLLLYAGFNIGDYLTDPLYYSILRPLRFCSLFFCLFLQGYRKKDLLIILPVSGVLYLSGRYSGNSTLLYLWMFIVMAREIRFRDVALGSTLLLTAGTVLFVILWLAGIAVDNLAPRDDGTIRHSFGYCHPNCLAQALVMMVMGWLCFRKTPLKLPEYLILTGLIVFLIVYPNSRTAAACLALFTVLAAGQGLFMKLSRQKQLTVAKLLTAAFLSGIAVFLLLCVIYDPSAAWMDRLNDLFSLRLEYSHNVLEEFGVSLMGQRVYFTPSERYLAGLTDLEERIVDVAYIHILLRNGLIPVLLLVCGFTASILHAGKTGKYSVMITMFTCGIFCLMENLFRNTAFCFFIIAVSGPLFDKDSSAQDTGNLLYLPGMLPRLRKTYGKDLLPIALFSAIFGFCTSLGVNILHMDSFTVRLRDVLFYTLLCGGLMTGLMLFSRHAGGRTAGAGQNEESLSFRQAVSFGLKYFLILLLSYGICLLAYFPGVGMNDGLNILFEGVTTSRYMPPIYVALVVLLGKIGTALGGIRYGVVLYSVIQLVITAGFTAAFLVWVRKKNMPVWCRRILFLYFVFSPLLALYSISMVKDTVFSLALTAVCLALSDAAANREYIKKKAFWPVFIALCVIMIIFRNNGPYIVLALAVVLLILFREHRKGIILLILAALLTMGAGKITKTRFHSEQLFQESVAIPLQQVCRVIAEDGVISEEQLEFMDELLPVETIKECYDPYCSDYIKWDLDFDHDLLNQRKADFMKLWLQLLPRNFGIYVKAFLQETFWFWAPVQEGELQVFYTIEGWKNDRPLSWFCMDNGILYSPLLPDSVCSLLSYWYELSSSFFREGVCFWIFAGLALLRFLRARRLLPLLDCLPVLLLWGTVMISTPISDSFRYVLVYAYILPLYAGELFTGAEKRSVSVVS